MIILVDYNLNREFFYLSGSLKDGGWLDLVDLRLVTFREIGLPGNSNDRVVWEFAQTNRMLLLSANRNAQGEDFFERVVRQENRSTSFPIIIIANPDLFSESGYRESCIENLVEIVIDIEYYMGAGRLFIP